MLSYVESNRGHSPYRAADDARAWPLVFGLLSLIFSTLIVVARVVTRRGNWTWSDSCLGKTDLRPIESLLR